MSDIWTSLIITVIGMGVIFIVLSLLLVTIAALNWAFPYKAPAPAASPRAGDAETVAVIQAAIAAYLKRRPEDIRIKSIK